MSDKVISIRVHENFPLTGAEVKKLVEATPLLFTAAVKGEVITYFRYNDEIRAILDKYKLWEEQQK